MEDARLAHRKSYSSGSRPPMSLHYELSRGQEVGEAYGVTLMTIGKFVLLHCSFALFLSTTSGLRAMQLTIEEPRAEHPKERKPITRLERTSESPGVITTRQRITPAGVAAVFHGQISAAVFGA